jgi:hypothetical protein
MTTTMNDETWIDLFTLELRVRRVPGPAIGDAVASVRELLADSGQLAEEAFGPAREYAASLTLPVMDARQQALKVVVIPVLALFTFLVFSSASVATFAGDLVLLSLPQVLLLALPVLLTLTFTLPSFYRAFVWQRWLPVILVLLAGAAGAIASFFAPSSAADAWLAFSATPLLIGAMSVLISLSVIGTVVTIRSGDGDEVTEPLQEDKPRSWRRRLTFLLFVDWLFPVLAIVVCAMTWALSTLRP